MTFRSYCFLMGFATLVCWSAVGAVLYAIDPFASGAFGITLFYASLFLALMGTLALAGIIMRKVLFHEEPHFVRVAVAFRQSILFALLIMTVLWLAHLHVLRWWLVVLLIVFFTVVEYLLLSLHQRHRAPVT